MFDPDLDLRLERIVEVPAEWLWRGWTDPELLPQWFCPKPWRVESCELDVRPGGLFKTVMVGPDPGQRFENAGSYLEVTPHQKLVWTTVLGEHLRPNAVPPGAPRFTATLEFHSEGSGSRYVATCCHATAEDQQAHSAMGFHEGWGKALDQLLALYQG